MCAVSWGCALKSAWGPQGRSKKCTAPEVNRTAAGDEGALKASKHTSYAKAVRMCRRGGLWQLALDLVAEKEALGLTPNRSSRPVACFLPGISLHPFAWSCGLGFVWSFLYSRYDIQSNTY